MKATIIILTILFIGIVLTGRHLCYKEYNIEIKYVHQLQNLYFALTGEELTIKP